MLNYSYETLGNVLNSIILIAGILYAACVIYFTQPGRHGVVDDGWKEDGFCIHNKEVAFWSSFDTCLYVDLLFSAILGLLYLKWRTILPEHCSQVVPMVIASTVGHGLAHGVMAQSFRSDDDTNNAPPQGLEDVPLWQSMAFCAFFWFPLLKASLPKVANALVAVLAVLVTYGPMLVGNGLPKEHGFAYVQTVVTLAFHTSQLLLDSSSSKTNEKQRREYFTLPLLAALPPMVASWNEALGCNAYFRDLGGHMLYDASIIIGFLVYYMDCYRHHVLVPQPSQKSSPTKKKVQ
jgi:hypothetical protein